MNSLIDRGLIECVGRLDVPGRPMQYGTTSDFLRCFGLRSIEDLPSASEDLINMFEKTRERTDAQVMEDEDQISITDIDASIADAPQANGEDASLPEENAVIAEQTENADTDDSDPSADDYVEVD
jgi:hypothetical protein